MTDEKKSPADYGDLLTPLPSDFVPTAEAPKNVKELIEQRQDLHGGRPAVRRVNRVFQQFAPGAQSKFVKMLDKQGEGAGAIPRLFRFLRNTIDGPKSILTEQEEKEVVDLYRQVQGAITRVDGKIIHAITPDDGLLLAAQGTRLMGRLLEKYSFAHIENEVDLICEQVATAVMDARVWWIENGYVMPKNRWEQAGQPFLARQHGGATPVQGELGEMGKVDILSKRKGEP